MGPPSRSGTFYVRRGTDSRGRLRPRPCKVVLAVDCAHVYRTDHSSRRLVRPHLPRRPRAPARSRHHPVPQGDRVPTSTSAAASSTSPPTSPTASGLQTGVATAMVDYPIGDLIAERVRAMGVTPFYKRFAHDGVTGPEHGHGATATAATASAPRSSSTTARNEAAARLKPGDFDWKAIFAGGVRWFHSGGIFAALSRDHARADHRGHAGGQGGRGGRLVRPQLPREALEGLRRRKPRPSRSSAASSSTSTCSSATRRTCRRASAFPGPEVAAKSKLDPSAFFGMIDRVREKHPQVKIVATTLREVHSTNRHSWSAVAWVERQDPRRPDLRTRRLRPRRRRRRVRGRLLLRPAHRRIAGAGAAARLGPRRAAHHVPRRHDDGDRGAGEGLRQGRLGAHSAVVPAWHEASAL